MRLRAFVLASLALSACGSAQPAQQPATLTAEQWREDLQTLARELPKRHANAFHTVTKARFDSMVAALGARLAGAHADSIVVGLASIAAAVGDGHTRVRLPAGWVRMPLTLEWFGCTTGSAGPCELRVTAAAPQHDRALGARVVAIEGIPAAQVHRALASSVARGETDGWTRELSARFVVLPNVLRGLGIASGTDAVTLTLTDSAGTSEMRVTSIARSASTASCKSAVPATPVARSRPREQLWLTLLADSQTVYVGFDGYPDKGAFRQLAKDVIALFDAKRAARVVIDMRRNLGGDFTKVREILLPPLAKHPVIGRKPHLYVLIGPSTFSAAMTNAIDFRKDANAILVGLPTGALPNSYQEGRDFTLPHSKLIVGFSTKYYRFQESDTPGVQPDLRVEPTWMAFRTGRDPALEAVMSAR
jgi:hypothetical protein